MAISAAISSYNAVSSGGNATIPSGQYRMAVVSYRYADVASPSGITIGGLACTKLVEKTYSTTLITQLWYLLIPASWAAGSQVLTITGGTGTSVGVYMLTGVNTTKVPLSFNGATADASATSIAMAVTGLTGGVILTGLYTGAGDGTNVFVADAFQTADVANARNGLGRNVGTVGALSAVWDWSSARAAALVGISVYPMIRPEGGPVYYD